MYDFMYVDPQTVPVEGHFLILKHFLQTTRKYQFSEQYQNIGWYLVTYVHDIMSYIITLIIHHLKKAIRKHIQR